MIVFTSVLPTRVGGGKKERGRKEGKKQGRKEYGSFIHSSLMLKSLKTSAITFSYSLGQDIRPSIFIKAPIGQKYLERRKARR